MSEYRVGRTVFTDAEMRVLTALREPNPFSKNDKRWSASEIAALLNRDVRRVHSMVSAHYFSGVSAPLTERERRTVWRAAEPLRTRVRASPAAASGFRRAFGVADDAPSPLPPPSRKRAPLCMTVADSELFTPEPKRVEFVVEEKRDSPPPSEPRESSESSAVAEKREPVTPAASVCHSVDDDAATAPPASVGPAGHRDDDVRPPKVEVEVASQARGASECVAAATAVVVDARKPSQDSDTASIALTCARATDIDDAYVVSFLEELGWWNEAHS